MEGEKKHSRVNPFVLGVWGIGLMLAGVVMLRPHLHMLLLGRFTFLAGLIVTIIACVVWVRQAREPEEEAPPQEEREFDDSLE